MVAGPENENEPESVPSSVASTRILVLALIPILAPFVGWALQERVPYDTLRGALLVSLLTHLGLHLSLTLDRRALRRASDPAPRLVTTASFLYFKYMESALLRGGFVVSGGSIAIFLKLISSSSSSDVAITLAMIPLALFALSVVRLQLLRASVMDGSFGTNATEVRAILNFILRHADQFKGGGGGSALVNERRAREMPRGAVRAREQALSAAGTRI
jgi:hypothetical protein